MWVSDSWTLLVGTKNREMTQCNSKESKEHYWRCPIESTRNKDTCNYSAGKICTRRLSGRMKHAERRTKMEQSTNGLSIEIHRRGASSITQVELRLASRVWNAVGTVLEVLWICCQYFCAYPTAVALASDESTGRTVTLSACIRNKSEIMIDRAEWAEVIDIHEFAGIVVEALLRLMGIKLVDKADDAICLQFLPALVSLL